MKKKRYGFVVFAALVMVLLFGFVSRNAEVTAASPKIRISAKSVVMAQGQRVKLSVKGTSKKVRWSSSNQKIAVVSSKGRVRALKKGKVTITARVGGKSYKCVVRVLGKKETDQKEEAEKMITMKIDGTEVSVNWEDNQTVKELKERLAQGELTIAMSMYGGFEQVGSLGKSYTRQDKQITTQAGDIVLYSGNQMVVFYGSNSWSYTRLGKISGLSTKELKALLGEKDVTIVLALKE